jgi:hypothetical protein
MVRADCDATALRLVLAERKTISHEDFQASLKEVRKYWDRRFEEILTSASQAGIEDLLDSFE